MVKVQSSGSYPTSVWVMLRFQFSQERLCMHWYSNLSCFICHSVPNLRLGSELSVFKAFDMLSRVRPIQEQLRVFI